MQNTKSYITGTIIVFLVILISSVILRLYDINKYDLWFDEIGSDLFSSSNIDRMAALSDTSKLSLMLDKIKNDTHSPLYYFLVYPYSLVFGGGKSLRFLSVFFSILSLGVFYRLSRLFFNRQTSIIALTIMALNPFHIWYAQEARAYAMACFFSLLMVYMCMKALKTNKLVYWISFPLAGILAIYSSYFSGLLLIALGMIALFKANRKYIKKMFLSGSIILLFLFFARTLMTSQFSFVKTDFWLPPPTISVMLFSWNVFNLGYSAMDIQYQLSMSLLLFLFSYGIYSCYRANKVSAITLLLLFLLPIITAYIISKTIMPVYINRQLLIFSPFCYLFIAKGLDSIKDKRAQMIAVSCVLSLFITVLLNYYRGFVSPTVRNTWFSFGVVPKTNYSNLIEHFDEEFKKGDLIAVADAPAYVLMLSHMNKNYKRYNYLSSSMLRFLLFPRMCHVFEKRFLGIYDLIESMPEEESDKISVLSPLPNGKFKLADTKLEEVVRIWLISTVWIKEGPLSPNTTYVKDFLDSNFKKIAQERQDGTFLELYEGKQ